MTKTFKLTAMLLLFSVGTFMQSFASATSHANREKPETIIFQYDTADYKASWTPVQGNGSYTVTVYDMTAGTLHSQSTTTNTYKSFSGLIVGHTYQINVAKGAVSDFLIIDIIDIG
jgi:ABC-type uncharacterized transport system YnjBCD substrate-binding protein